MLKTIEKELAESKAAGIPWAGVAKITQSKKPRTFEEAAKDYMEERADKKPSTISAYNYILKSRLLLRLDLVQWAASPVPILESIRHR